MKCDELKAGVIVPPHDEGMCFDIGPDVIAVTERETEFYLKSDVDAAIAELKAEINRKDGVGKRWFKRCMEARSENIKLKCALWIARAKRALEKIAWFKLWNASISTMNPEDCARQEFDKWKKNLGKFLKKAEEYK